MKGRNLRRVGTAYEEKGAAYLKTVGYTLLQQNFRCRQGEIDLIVRSPKGTLVFVEVKYRQSDSAGSPGEAVGLYKQRRICRTALYYLLRNGYSMETPCRFDVLEFDGEALKHVQNAFDYIE